MAATAAAGVSAIHHHDVNKLTNEIFSILENKFLFGYQDDRNKVRILSIDGGDGILAAGTLLHLQSILRRKSGNPTAHISDFFDVVAGAGAGGVLAGLLFTRGGRDGAPLFTAEDSLKFMLDNSSKMLLHYSTRSSSLGLGLGGLFKKKNKNNNKNNKLDKVFGDLTLRDTLKPVLIPCYDLRSGAPFLFSHADAMEMEGCDFRMAGACGATLAADQAVELKSTDGRKKMVAVGGTSNPTAAAITHVLNNKHHFPLCKGVQDLLLLSLGSAGSTNHFIHSNPNPMPSSLLLQIAADGAADMVDQAVSMAFGEWRTSNYIRIQGNGMIKRNTMLSIVDEILAQKNVESILFKGKRMVEYTNMEKLEMFAGEAIKEAEKRNKSSNNNILMFNNNNNNNAHYNSPTRSSSASATTLSTLSSSC